MPDQTILVVDDEPHIVEVVRDYLKQAGFHVLTAGDGQSALTITRKEHPDLVVLDLLLPGRLDGLDVCRSIRQDNAISGTPIIMLTAKVELTDRLIGLELGADDYITKPFSPREVVARVKAVLRRFREGTADRKQFAFGNLKIDLTARAVSVGDKRISLTPTEYDLLTVLARYPGRPFTRAQLVEHIYDVAYGGYDRAIDSHIKNLRRKIESDPGNPTFIITVYGVGYKLGE
jgi:two-component system alkaline phosphatase synthesis response regulator PhoP